MGSTRIVALASAATESDPVVGVTKTVLTVGFAGFADFTDLRCVCAPEGVTGTLVFPNSVPCLRRFARGERRRTIKSASVVANITRRVILTV